MCKTSKGIDLELTNSSVYLKIQKVGDGSKSYFLFFSATSAILELFFSEWWAAEWLCHQEPTRIICEHQNFL